MTKFYELQAGDLFTIEGKKSPLGFITVQDGITHYGLDPETVVLAKKFSTELVVRITQWCFDHNMSMGFAKNLIHDVLELNADDEIEAIWKKCHEGWYERQMAQQG